MKYDLSFEKLYLIQLLLIQNFYKNKKIVNMISISSQNKFDMHLKKLDQISMKQKIKIF